jgi:hypothetical protein
MTRDGTNYNYQNTKPPDKIKSLRDIKNQEEKQDEYSRNGFG